MGFDTSLNGHRGDSEFARDLAHTLSIRVQPECFVAAEYSLRPAAMLAIGLGVGNPRIDALDDHSAFKFGKAR